MRRTVLFLFACGLLPAQTLINGDRVILGSINAGRSNVGTDSYALTLATCGGFKYSPRQPFILEADVANTGAATVNVCSAGAKTIKKCGGADLVTGDIKAGDFLMLQYDGTNMRAHGLCGVSVTSGALTFQGLWNASTNTPTLADGTGTQGQYYVVSVAGTVDLGSGSKTYTVGDWVLHNGSIWDKLDAINDVSSVFGRTGVVVAASGDYTASQVTNVATGGIAATQVQAAIDELDTEKATASATLTANLPVIGNGTNALTVGTRQGNTTKYVSYSGSAPSTNDCAKFDSNGNLTTASAVCGSGGGGGGASGANGSLYLSTTATTTVTAGVYSKLNGTTTSVNLSDFTMPSNNRLTYTGTTTIRFNVVSVVSLQASGSNQTVSIRLAKNATTDAATDVTARLGNSGLPSVLATTWNVSLATNDFIEVFATSAGNTTLTAAKLELSVFPLIASPGDAVVMYVAAVCQGTVASLGVGTPTTEAATSTCEGTNIRKAYARFPNSGVSRVNFRFRLIGFAGTTFDWGGYWKATTATSGSVVWQLRCAAVANDEDPDPAYGTAVTVTDAALGTAGRLNSFGATGVTLTGAAVDEEQFCELFRDSAHASDDLADNADLESFYVIYRR